MGLELGFHPGWADSMEQRQVPPGETAVGPVEVEDIIPNCCMSHFQILVVSAKFKVKTLLQRHGLVNMCLAGDLLHNHAFELKTLTPEQWAHKQQKWGTRDQHKHSH